MKVIYKKLKEIKPYKNNPRKNDGAVDACARSIREFGFRVPIVVDADGEIVAGHTRYKAAKKLGLRDVPCIIADGLTPEQIKAFRLVDNKTQELSSWDYGVLLPELDMIEADFEVEPYGFNTGDKETGARSQVLDEGEEIDLSSFSDDVFNCTCPSCGFRFND